MKSRKLGALMAMGLGGCTSLLSAGQIGSGALSGGQGAPSSSPVGTAPLAASGEAPAPSPTPFVLATLPPDLGSRPFITSYGPVNGAIGTQVVLHGANFGAARVQVTFNGSLSTDTKAIDNDTLTATLPFGATTGNILVSDAGQISNAAPFYVIKGLSLSGGGQVLLGATMSVGVSAQDPMGESISSPAVSWSAAGTSVVIDSNGLVTAIDLGNSIITATTGGLSASKSIHVFDVTGVALNQVSLTLSALPQNGGSPASGYVTSATLQATVVASDGNNRSVSWRSLDPTLASVTSAGFVGATTTSVGGTAIITATSVDDPSKVATCSVTVVPDGSLNLGVN